MNENEYVTLRGRRTLAQRTAASRSNPSSSHPLRVHGADDLRVFERSSSRPSPISSRWSVLDVLAMFCFYVVPVAIFVPKIRFDFPRKYLFRLNIYRARVCRFSSHVLLCFRVVFVRSVLKSWSAVGGKTAGGFPTTVQVLFSR